MTMEAIATALSVGVDARAALSVDARGEVFAAFPSSLYLRLQGGWACLGGECLPDGPLNVRCRAARPLDWLSLGRGQPIATRRAGIYFQCGLHIALAGAATWSPPAQPAWTPVTLARGLAGLHKMLPPAMPNEGLACLLRPDSGRSRVAATAQPALHSLASWLAASSGSRPPIEAVSRLIGLGPGLTPSGDDYLAGCLASLRALGRNANADALWSAIDELGTGATVDISLVHLRCAAAGRLMAPLHAVLNALLSGDQGSLKRALKDWTFGEHCSPWDALAGIAATLTALREAQPLAA